MQRLGKGGSQRSASSHPLKADRGPHTRRHHHANSRRLGFLFVLPGVFTGATPAGEPSALAGRRPNIILILTDDQGYGDIARHGNPVIKTPNLDRLYDEGVRLTDYHVSPTCSPTRCSIMTGRHEFKSGVTHTIMERERMSLRATTIAQVLQSAGYKTGIFGKWHLGDEPDHWPSRRGFDEMFIHGAGGIGQSYPGTCGDAPGNGYFDPVILHNGTFEKTSGYCTDVFFGQAIRWIEATKGSQPLFAYITPNAPHGPLICPENYEAMYRDKVKPDVAKFLGMVTNIDDNVGRLLAKLKELEIERNTLVIFMNDNGGTAGCSVWNAGMRGQKGGPDNGGTRAAGFFRWPGTLQPGNRDQLTAHLDLYPTFAALAGAKIPEGVKSGWLQPAAAAGELERRLARTLPGHPRRPLAARRSRAAQVLADERPPRSVPVGVSRPRRQELGIVQFERRSGPADRLGCATTRSREPNWKPIMTSGGRRSCRAWKTKTPRPPRRR